MTLIDLFKQAIPENAVSQNRTEGAAFLGVARNLYKLAHIDYLALNIPGKKWRKTFMHCCHSDSALSQCVTDMAAAHDIVAQLDWPLLKSVDAVDTLDWKGGAAVPEGQRGLVFSLRTECSEIALASISWEQNGTAQAERIAAARDLKLLMNYFHNQLLRINGIQAANEILLSTRELDCLSWTAAGKTAWEASIILGITERTVRFHLNIAREKLKCATTTQAVAKAVSNKLIELRA